MPKDINDLRRDRKAAADRMQETADQITAIEGAEGDLDEGALAQATGAFEAAQGDFAKADAAVKRAEHVEAANAAAASGGDDSQPVATGGHADTSPQSPARPRNTALLGVGAALMVGALAATRGDATRAADRLDAAGHSELSASLRRSDDAAGGITIPQAQSSELIEMLKPRVAVMRAGARVIPMPAGELRHARQNSSANASYTAELQDIPTSEQTFGNRDMTFKKLTAMVPVSNSLLRHSSIAMAQLVRDDMIDVMALRRDLAFTRGDGLNNTPTGIVNWVPAAHNFGARAKDPATVEATLRGMVSRVDSANVGMVNSGWVMHPSAKHFLASLREPSSGVKLFPSIEINDTLLGYPIYTTSQLPTNLGDAGDEAEIIFGDFNQVMIGDTMDITIATSTEASYVASNGTVRHAFQRDETLMRAISEHDLAPRHDEALALARGQGWSL
ncbi:phage major capsid protein [Palleronia sp. LCG004]|uniref:phage major capsid protein n=1 Tax=Palleronia sp. LCG004 TaxID=3079304 RepID=UPI0029431B9B|nr:phage major capsid protein [Palleronia sp. LCG004]WOI54964.1 phage major capsid protein [Palleronia sp. LCG004]